MSRRPEKYLYDVRRAASLIARFTSGKPFGDYQADPLLRSGVERQFEIIGEALAQLGRLDADMVDAIPGSRQAIGLRNNLIHGYAQVDNEIVWRTLDEDMPAPRAAVGALMPSDAPE